MVVEGGCSTLTHPESVANIGVYTLLKAAVLLPSITLRLREATDAAGNQFVELVTAYPTIPNA